MFGHQLGCDEGSLLKRIARSCLTIAQSCQATALRATTLNSSTVNIGLHHREQELGGEKNSIKKLMGEQWNLLHPNIQARFIREPGLTEPILYRGMMEKVECSFAGKLFAQVMRWIANPLTPYEGKNVAMDVTLYQDPNISGVYWRRTYYHAGRLPYTVTSVKKHDKDGTLMECVGAGFGMELELTAPEGNLLFRSTHYFWRIGVFCIRLPHTLTPGETRVTHEELGGGFFRFTISIDHVYLGRTFYQTGVFSEV